MHQGYAIGLQAPQHSQLHIALHGNTTKVYTAEDTLANSKSEDEALPTAELRNLGLSLQNNQTQSWRRSQTMKPTKSKSRPLRVPL